MPPPAAPFSRVAAQPYGAAATLGERLGAPREVAGAALRASPPAPPGGAARSLRRIAPFLSASSYARRACPPTPAPFATLLCALSAGLCARPPCAFYVHSVFSINRKKNKKAAKLATHSQPARVIQAPLRSALALLLRFVAFRLLSFFFFLFGYGCFSSRAARFGSLSFFCGWFFRLSFCCSRSCRGSFCFSVCAGFLSHFCGLRSWLRFSRSGCFSSCRCLSCFFLWRWSWCFCCSFCGFGSWAFVLLCAGVCFFPGCCVSSGARSLRLLLGLFLWAWLRVLGFARFCGRFGGSVFCLASAGRFFPLFVVCRMAGRRLVGSGGVGVHRVNFVR